MPEQTPAPKMTSLRSFARKVGCTHPNVSKAIQTGRLEKSIGYIRGKPVILGPASRRGMRSWVAIRPRPGRSCACSLADRIVCTPRRLPEGRFYEFTATATYEALLGGVVAALVPPEESGDSDAVEIRGIARPAA